MCKNTFYHAKKAWMVFLVVYSFTKILSVANNLLWANCQTIKKKILNTHIEL